MADTLILARITVVAAIFSCCSLQIQADETKCPNPKGFKPDPTTVQEMLRNHREWLKDSEVGRRAILCEAILTAVNLAGANLDRANLEHANLERANLAGASLYRANLEHANLERANLSWAQLGSANLKNAILREANLQQALLLEADLRNASLSEANFQNAILYSADLRDAHLTGTNLQEAKLFKADLRKASLIGAELQRADLSSANLQGAQLVGANFNDADLVWANLADANLLKAEMQRARLSFTNLERADLTGANVRGATFIRTNVANANFTEIQIAGAQYQANSTPLTTGLGGIVGLTEVGFSEGQQGALVLLRGGLRDAGLRELERQATYAIERLKTNYAPWPERYFRRLLFEWTAWYGLYPSWCLFIVIELILLLGSVVYIHPILGSGRSCIVRIWPKDRIALGKKTPRVIRAMKTERLHATGFFTAWGYALYFSLLSALHIGWRDLNVGSWIVRIQPKPYVLQAIGWVRVVSGLQSIISVYLIALWVLTYFGRPFQ